MDETILTQNTEQSPIPPVIPSPPPLVARIKTKNWVLISLVLFVIFLSLGAAGFFAYQYMQLKQQINSKPTPSPTSFSKTPPADPTADWKTYNNTLYKFSHKFPPQAEMKEIITQSKGNNKVLFAIDTSEIGETQNPNTEFYDGYSFTVVVVEKSPTETISDVSSEYISNCNEVGDLTKPPESITVNGIKGITHSCRGLGEYKYILFPAPKTNGYYFEIRTFYEGPNKTNYQKTVNQILSSFKLLDQSTTTYLCPANGWVGCMPGQEAKPECSTEAMSWYKTNCPNFKGAAL